jgi:phosphoserine phosphatase RsbU/P
MAVATTLHPGETAILVQTGSHQRRLVITKLPFTIGRAEECDATIADFKVSRQHAKVVMEGNEYFLVDTESRHGTFLNGVRCQRAKLKNRDEITLGVTGVKIIFLHDTPVSSAANMLLTRLGSGTDISELEKLRLFLEAARSLTGGLVVNDVLRNMLDYALKITKAERGFVYLKDREKNGAPVMACGRDSAGVSTTNDANVSHSVVHEAMTSASEFITGDALKQQALAARQSIMLNELRTVIRHSIAYAARRGRRCGRGALSRQPIGIAKPFRREP